MSAQLAPLIVAVATAITALVGAYVTLRAARRRPVPGELPGVSPDMLEQQAASLIQTALDQLSKDLAACRENGRRLEAKIAALELRLAEQEGTP